MERTASLTYPLTRAWVTRGVLVALVALFALAVVRTAWVCDDAYITFRTIENFHHGFGLRFNVDERVQAFTHPLWLFVLSSVRAYSGELYYSAIAVSTLLSIATVMLAVTRVARSTRHAMMIALLSVGSIAFVDYSTSGLENPLSHLLLVLFYVVALGTRPAARTLFLLTLVAALAVLNRPDVLLLYLPALVVAFVRGPSVTSRLGAVACGLAPLVLWEGFALLYYGFPAPNTAYAKLATGIPRGELVAQGLRYLEHGALVDPLTLLVTLLAVVLAVARPGWFAGLPARTLALGVVLYLVWVVRIGGDFMAGRFLTLPFLAGVLLLSRVELPARWWSGGRAKAVVACFAGLIVLATVPRFLATEREVVADSGIADERRAYQSLSLSNRLGRESLPDHPWAAAGDRLRREGRPVVQVAGGIGLLGYYAGDVAHVLDVHGLSDPLLARLPANDDWRVGHYVRTPRRDYVDSLRTGRNVIVDPDLHRYYEKLRLITRGALLDPERLRAIVGMQLGRYDGWRDRYLARRARTASR